MALGFLSAEVTYCSGTRAFALGQLTNGLTAVGRSFAKSDQVRFALSNGDSSGFVFIAFQVLLVRPTEGLCWQCCVQIYLSAF
jgi:hypothetical protein